MIFSTDNLYKQENINNTPTNNKVTITVSEKTSLFLDALKYIIEEDRLFAEEVNKYNISTYSNKRKALCEKTIDVNININTPNMLDINSPRVPNRFLVYPNR